VDKGGVLEVTALDARTRRPVAGAQLSAGDSCGTRVISDQRRVGRGVHRVPADTYKVAVVAGLCPNGTDGERARGADRSM